MIGFYCVRTTRDAASVRRDTGLRTKMRLAWRIRRHRLALLCLSALAGLTPYLAASADEMPSATRLDTARAMLATADVPATAPLALLSVDCPMGIGSHGQRVATVIC